MPIKNFLKDNVVLVIGLSLPVLLILLFFMATVLPKSSATPPQHGLLFAYVRYDYQSTSPYNIDFFVKDRALRARISTSENKNSTYNKKQLMLYDGKTESVREIVFDPAQFAKVNNNADVILAETQHLQIDSATSAPDGYRFEGPNYGHGGLIGELFGGGYRNQLYRVKKGNVAYKIPNTQNTYYNNLQFLGWVIADSK